MDREHIQKLVNAIRSDYTKPNVDISMCDMCNKMTDNWFNINHHIIWRCRKCCYNSKQNLEKILEKMCDKK